MVFFIFKIPFLSDRRVDVADVFSENLKSLQIPFPNLYVRRPFLRTRECLLAGPAARWPDGHMDMLKLIQNFMLIKNMHVFCGALPDRYKRFDKINIPSFFAIAMIIAWKYV